MRARALIPVLLTLAIGAAPAGADPVTDSAAVERGRYLAITSACHDCHTPNYPETAGQVDPDLWLTGNAIGFQGPWGTSYPVNLRLYVQQLSEADWVKRAREPMRPPMPWFNLRDMTDADLRALYLYIRSLGPSGTPAPAPAAPGVVVNTPYYDFMPKNLPMTAAH